MQSFKATRMELLNLRKRRATAQRGYKLLKEKRDGLMQKLMELIKELKEKKALLEKSFSLLSKELIFSSASFSQKELEEIFSIPLFDISFEIKEENIMSVWIPRFIFSVQKNKNTYSDISIPLSLRKSIENFAEIFQDIIRLTELEHSARLLALEIEKARRRVNALEFLIIPQINSMIKFISSKLEEAERNEKIVRMRIKEMITI